jgi:NitT/TauT family transport system substrate-binding protein
MRYNEFHTLLQSGFEEDDVTVFTLRDYGIQLPEDGVYALAETWQRRPRTCLAFVRASLDGWRYARDHTEETLDVVMRYVNEHQLPTNRAHMHWMLREMIASVFPGPEDDWTVGRLSRDDYKAALELLTRHADLQDAPSYDAFVVGEDADD